MALAQDYYNRWNDPISAGYLIFSLAIATFQPTEER